MNAKKQNKNKMYYDNLYAKREQERQLKLLVNSLTEEEKTMEDFVEIVEFVDRLREKKRLENLKYKLNTLSKATKATKVKRLESVSKMTYSQLYESVKTLPHLSDLAKFRLSLLDQPPRTNQKAAYEDVLPLTDEMEKYEFDIFALNRNVIFDL